MLEFLELLGEGYGDVVVLLTKFSMMQDLISKLTAGKDLDRFRLFNLLTKGVRDAGPIQKINQYWQVALSEGFS